MDSHAEFKAGFDSPDPENREKLINEKEPDEGKVKNVLTFCGYWTVR